MTDAETSAATAQAPCSDQEGLVASSDRRRPASFSKLYTVGGLMVFASLVFSGTVEGCDNDDNGGGGSDPPPVTTRPPTTTAPPQQQCWIFCSDFEVENDDGSTTVYDHDTGTMVTQRPDGTTTSMNVHTGETTTQSTSSAPASQESIEQQFLGSDGENGRDGQAGVDAMNEWIETENERRANAQPPEQPLDPDDEVPRNAVNYAHCVSFGLSGCDINDPEATQQVMFEEGVSQGYTGDGTYQDFGGDEGTTNFENGIWFDRCPNSICGEGYRPPGGHTGGGGTCSGGLTVVSTHIDSATGDNGCRPPHCDFGRDADGWCLPPGSSDPPVVYVISPSPAVENGGSVQFAVALSHAYTQQVTVDVATSDGTATEGDDYRQVNQTVTIPARNTVTHVSVPLVDDSTYEPPEYFTLTLSNVSSNASLSQTPDADAMIDDNDPRPPVILSVSGTPSVTEGGRMEFKVTPDVAPAAEATVQFRVRPEHYDGHPLYVKEGYYCGQPPDADYRQSPMTR